MIFSLLCVLCLGFKSHFVQFKCLAGLICKILLLQNVDNYLFQLNFGLVYHADLLRSYGYIYNPV